MKYSCFGCALERVRSPDGKLVNVAVEFGDNEKLQALEQAICDAEVAIKTDSASSVLAGLAMEAKAIADYYNAMAEALSEAKPSDVECYDVQ